MAAPKNTTKNTAHEVSDNKLIGYGLLIVGLLLCVLTAGVGGTLNQLAANQWQAGDLSLQLVLDAFVKVLPVSVSMLLILFGWLRGWLDDIGWAFIYIVVVVIVCTLLLQPQGWQMVKQSWQERGNGPFGFVARLAVGYWALYGGKVFLAGIISGAFAGWVAFVKTARWFK